MSNYTPKKTKYKKFQKMNYRLKGLSSGLCFLSIKEGFFIKSLQSKRLQSYQIEASRRILRRILKKKGRIELPLNFTQALTTKSSGVRMGKGKGAVSGWIAPLNTGRLLLFLYNVNYLQGYYSLLKAKKKIAFNTLILSNYGLKKKSFFSL